VTGTRRIHADRASGLRAIMLKVSTGKNTGSQQTWLTGSARRRKLHQARLPKAKAPDFQDEIVQLHRGAETAHVWLGEKERDSPRGGFVFIPANNG